MYIKGKKEITATVDLSILQEYIDNLSINERMPISGMRNIPGILLFWLNT